MKLIFFDEAKNDPDYHHYHIGAVCIDESALIPIEGQINGLALDTFGSMELGIATEFHAAEIFHRKKNFKSWHEFDKRIAVLGRLVDILSMPEVQRIDVQINCDLLHPSQSAEEIAFMFLCERANDLVRSQGALGMLIGDRESDQHAALFAATLSGYRAKGTDFAFGRSIRNLVDSVHFTHSHLSRFLQLADFYVWLLQFIHRNRGSDNARHLALFNIIDSPAVNLFPAKYKEWPRPNN